MLISGSATNVHPSLYGAEWTDADGPFDPARDATSLELIRQTIERGIPLLAICRGIQELNVALGGTLAREIQEQPGNWDHRKPPVESRDEMYSIRQPVLLEEGSCMERYLGLSGEVQVNSLHRQAIGEKAPRLQVEAKAEDGTIEAVSVIDAKGFAVACNGIRNIGQKEIAPPAPCSNPLARRFANTLRTAPRPDYRLTGVSGTAVSNSPFSNQLMRLSTTRSAMSLRVGTDAEATCGSMQRLGKSKKPAGMRGSS